MSNNFKKVCRTCSKEADKLIPLFDNTDQHNYIENLYLMFDIRVSENDDLPKSICIMCAFRIKETYEFKRVCKKSEKTLMHQIQNNVTDSDEQNCSNIAVNFNYENGKNF